MKKIFKIIIITIAIFAFMCLCSCVEEDKNGNHVFRKELNTVVVGEDSHEFLAVETGCEHWPDCRFCKEKNQTKLGSIRNLNSGDTLYIHPGETQSIHNNQKDYELKVKIL